MALTWCRSPVTADVKQKRTKYKRMRETIRTRGLQCDI